MSLVDVATDFYWHLPASTSAWKSSDAPAVVWQTIQKGLVNLVGPTISSGQLAPALRSLDPAFPQNDPPGGPADYAAAAALLKASSHDPNTPGSLWQELSQPIVVTNGWTNYHDQVSLPIDGDDIGESYSANAARWSVYALKEKLTASQGPFRITDISPLNLAYGTDVNAILGNLYQLRMTALQATSRKLVRLLGRMRGPAVHATAQPNGAAVQRVQTAQQQVSAILVALAQNPSDPSLRGYLYWWQQEWSNAIAAMGQS